MDRTPAVRLDVWLDVACLFKTRSDAQKACRGGKVDVNGATAKPHRTLQVGDAIRISRPLGRKQTLIVRALEERHVPKTEARRLYQDTTPLPTAEEATVRRLERQWRASQRATQIAPSRRDRRAARTLKERGDRG